MSSHSMRRAHARALRPLILVSAALAALAGAAAACSSPDASTSEGDATEGLSVHFDTAYSAFDGVHTYKIPAMVEGVKKPKWSASPSDLVDLEPQSDGTVMITTRGVGTVTITAKSGNLSGSSELTIEQASPEEWQAGSDRYNNGIVFQRPDGGWEGGRGDGGGGHHQPNPELACTNCHAKGKDAGAPPPDTQDDDIKRLASKTDPFAEDAGKTRPEEGHESGIDGGTETDPNKVRAGDTYLALLGEFFGKRLTVPSVISVGESRKLCTVFQVNVNRTMVIWHVRQQPVKSSGNELFDDAARSMLLKMLDDKVRLPEPPKEYEDQIRGRTVNIVIPGDPHGDASRCKL